jgi:hypothetical protein
VQAGVQGGSLSLVVGAGHACLKVGVRTAHTVCVEVWRTPLMLFVGLQDRLGLYVCTSTAGNEAALTPAQLLPELSRLADTRGHLCNELNAAQTHS